MKFKSLHSFPAAFSLAQVGMSAMHMSGVAHRETRYYQLLDISLVAQPCQIFWWRQNCCRWKKIRSNSKKIKINEDCSRCINFFCLFLQRQRSRSKHTENRIATASKWACATPRLSQTTNCHLHPPLQSGRNLDPQKPRSQKKNPDLKTKIQISKPSLHPPQCWTKP